jgi:hypothetical protein
MSSLKEPVTFVTFACRNDVHYAKALLGSIAHFYPSHPIRVVLEADVSSRDHEQLARFPNVTVHRVAELIGLHGLKLTRLLAKLNVLLLPGVQQALVADADSVLVDLVLERIPERTLFAGLTARPVNLDDPLAREAFSRWAIDLDRLSELGWKLRQGPTTFVGGSHFFVDVARFPKRLLPELLPVMGLGHDTTTPLRAGDQGFWTYLANVCDSVDPRELHFFDVAPDATPTNAARFPMAHDPAWLADRRAKDLSFIHYIGFSRRFRRKAHQFPNALVWATRRYYEILGNPGDFPRDEARRISLGASKALRRAIMAPLRAIRR